MTRIHVAGRSSTATRTRARSYRAASHSREPAASRPRAGRAVLFRVEPFDPGMVFAATACWVRPGACQGGRGKGGGGGAGGPGRPEPAAGGRGRGAAHCNRGLKRAACGHDQGAFPQPQSPPKPPRQRRQRRFRLRQQRRNRQQSRRRAIGGERSESACGSALHAGQQQLWRLQNTPRRRISATDTQSIRPRITPNPSDAIAGARLPPMPGPARAVRSVARRPLRHFRRRSRRHNPATAGVRAVAIPPCRGSGWRLPGLRGRRSTP